MSYDYMLVKGTHEPGIVGFEEFLENATQEPIGSLEEIEARISQLFPAVKWEPPAATTFGDVTGTSARGYDGPPEFHLTLEGGQVMAISMSRCKRAEVEQVAEALGLMAVDEQET